MKYSIILAGAIVHSCYGLAPPVPSPTDPLVGGVDLRGFTPKPTNAAVHPDLKARQAGSQDLLGYLAPDNTCGYVSGLIGGVKTCDSTQRCAGVVINSVATMGCCDTAQEACTWLGNCVGYQGYYSSSLCGHACQQDINTIKCTNSAKPYCYSYLVPSASIGFFSCDSTFSSKFDRFETTFSGETSVRTWKKIYDTDTTASSSAIIPTSTHGTVGGFVLTSTSGSGASSTDTFASASTAVGSTGSSGSSSSTTQNTTKAKKSPIGGIVGGVVGGLFVIGAAIVLLVLLLMKKKKNNNTNDNNATPAAGAMSSGPGMAQQQSPQHFQQNQYTPQGQYQQPQQPAPQGQYNVGTYDNQNLNNGTQSGAAGYYAAFPGKMDEPYNSTSKDGIAITEQQIPITPVPGSPAPPYAIPMNELASPMGSPPPPANSPPPHMLQGQHYSPQAQGFQPQPPQPAPAELGTTYGVPSQTRDGRPVFEAA